MSAGPGPHGEEFGLRAQRNFSEERFAWLRVEDQMLVAEMGGVWPEQPEHAEYRRVLDIGCGAGYRLLSAARAYPGIEQLCGVDTRAGLIKCARQLASQQQVDDRVEFQVMDALHMLEFPFRYFDLVNIQMGGYFLRTWEWSKLLQECRRVTRPGGTIRALEQDFIGESNSPALNALMQLLVQTYYQAGHLFSADHEGLLREMPRLFEQFGIRKVQARPHTVEYRADTAGWPNFVGHFQPAITPFVAKWWRIPENYDDLYRQTMEEITRPDFVARRKFLVVWGQK
ncbi:MAG TPA: methyltransferase domain-containing protein [Ktedonobacteraceae bacterium]